MTQPTPSGVFVSWSALGGAMAAAAAAVLLRWALRRPGHSAIPAATPPSAAFTHRLTAILPCRDLDASEAFYARLGLVRTGPAGAGDDTYRILSDGLGAHVHLTDAVPGWLPPNRNPFGLYLYTRDVDAMAARFPGEVLEREGPSAKPWGMYEFALSDPSDTLVRVGCPLDQRRSGPPTEDATCCDTPERR